jgi:mRNA interferase HigB
MKVVGLPILDAFSRKHTDVRSQIEAWVAEVDKAEWKTPLDIKARYSSASFLADNRVIFNLKGNNYRLRVAVAYKNQIVVVEAIGTHAEYSKWES